MSTDRREEIDELLGAYALDAIDADDRTRVEVYLGQVAIARAEADELRETAAMLALTPMPDEPAPDGLWDRIRASIAEPETETDTETHQHAPVVALPARRAVPWTKLAPVAAAAAVIIGLLAYQVVDLRGQVDDAKHTGVLASEALYNRATKVPGAQFATLQGNGAPVARIVVLPDGTGYLVNNSLNALPANETYQLWALVGNPTQPTVISAGVLGPSPRAAAFKVSGPVVGFAVTQEHAPGVVSSHNQPVAVAKLS